jgi:stage V sporulation protein AE
MDYLIAFVVGGIICAFVQILMEKTKLMPGRIMVILVIAGAILGAVGVYEPFAKWAKAGATVPLTGFGNLLYQGVKQAVDMEGFLGIFLLRHITKSNHSAIHHFIGTKHRISNT